MTLEILGVVVGLLYLWLEYKANWWLWIAGTVMPAIYLFVYYDTGLYADMAISIYYIVASVYGLVCWFSHKSRGGESVPKPISYTPRRIWLPLALITLLVWFTVAWLLIEFTDSTVPWADAATTALSVSAMWMLAKKYVEQWIVWAVADVGCCALYCYKDLWVTGGLYLLYAVIAVLGYRKWIAFMKDEINNEGGRD